MSALIPTEISLVKAQVPEYLQSSPFFLSLADDDNQTFNVPENCLKPDETIRSRADVANYLSTIRFWGVTGIPTLLLKLATNPAAPKDWQEECTPYLEDFPYLKTLVDISRLEPHKMVACAAMAPWVDICRFLCARHFFIPDNVCFLAGTNGRLANLRYFHEEQHKSFPVWFTRDMARLGHAQCLEYAVQHGASIYPMCVEASAAHGHIESLEVAFRYGQTGTPRTCVQAAENGHLECLIFLHEHGCPWDSSVYHAAMRGNQFACFCYAVDSDCPWDDDFYISCATRSDLDWLVYAHERGHALTESLTSAAARAGMLHNLQYLCEHGCSIGDEACVLAAQRGHAECLQYLIQQGAPRSPATYLPIVRSLRAVQLLRSVGCPWDSRVAIAAVREDNLNSLCYLTEQGCPWYCAELPERCVCSAVAACGEHLLAELLAYVATTPCPCPKDSDGVSLCAGVCNHPVEELQQREQWRQAGWIC